MTKDEALKMAIEYIENQEIKLSFDNLKAKADALNACYKALINKEWQGLTDNEIWNIAQESHEGLSPFDDTMRFARAIEQALKEKNHDIR